MNKYNYSHLLTIYTLFFLSIILITSCTAPKKIVRDIIPIDKHETPEVLFNKLKQNELKFQFLSASFNADAVIDNNHNTFNGNVRIKKDSLIWLSISKMAIEVLRLKLSQDSFMLINRINKTYFLDAFDNLNIAFNTNLDFDIIQALIVGNDMSFYEKDIFKSSIDDNMYKLSTPGREKLKKYVKNENERQKVLVQNIWINPDNFKIVRNSIKEIKNNNRKLIVTYSKFNALENQLFPYTVSFNIQSETPVNIVANYTRIRIDEKTSFPFSIPSNYKFEKIDNFKYNE